MPQKAPQVFGAILSLAVLVIYAVLLGAGIYNAFVNPDVTYTDNSLQAANLVTGLVGSVVAVGLALKSPPEDRDGDGRLRRNVTALSRMVAPQRASVTVQEVVGWAYLIVWLIIGLAAFLVAVTRTQVPELVFNTGWTWLGTAVVAAYSFFGIEQG
ncbi:MAG TPA: hypothetical protein G4O02_06390 [Caldilineae bacterium]|nr:hypothetical protein [Caldilineae bacterium]